MNSFLLLFRPFCCLPANLSSPAYSLRLINSTRAKWPQSIRQLKRQKFTATKCMLNRAMYLYNYYICIYRYVCVCVCVCRLNNKRLRIISGTLLLSFLSLSPPELRIVSIFQVILSRSSNINLFRSIIAFYMIFLQTEWAKNCPLYSVWFVQWLVFYAILLDRNLYEVVRIPFRYFVRITFTIL